MLAGTTYDKHAGKKYKQHFCLSSVCLDIHLDLRKTKRELQLTRQTGAAGYLLFIFV